MIANTLRTVLDWRSPIMGGLVLVYGAAGTGKSSLLRKIGKELSLPPISLSVVQVNRADSTGLSVLAALYEVVIADLFKLPSESEFDLCHDLIDRNRSMIVSVQRDRNDRRMLAIEHFAVSVIELKCPRVTTKFFEKQLVVKKNRFGPTAAFKCSTSPNGLFELGEQVSK